MSFAMRDITDVDGCRAVVGVQVAVGAVVGEASVELSPTEEASTMTEEMVLGEPEPRTVVTVIRAVVLPSVMSLLGEANWWAPKFLRKRPAPEPVVDEPQRELINA